MGNVSSGTNNKRIVVTCPKCKTEYHTDFSTEAINEIHKCINCQTKFKLTNQINIQNNSSIGTDKHKQKSVRKFMSRLKEALINKVSSIHIRKHKKIEVICPLCNKQMDIPYSKNALNDIHNCAHCGKGIRLKFDKTKSSMNKQNKFKKSNETPKQQQNSNSYTTTINVNCPNCRRLLSIAKTADVYSKRQLCPICKFSFTVTNEQRSNTNNQSSNTQNQQQRSSNIYLGEYIELLNSAKQNLNTDSSIALIKLRIFGEKIADGILAARGINVTSQITQKDKLKMLERGGMIPYNIARCLHQIRITGNKAAHNSYKSVNDAQKLLAGADMILNWFRSQI